MEEDKKSDTQVISNPVYGQFTDYQNVKLPIPRVFKATHTPRIPTPRTFNDKKYYGVEAVAKILGIITLPNAAPYATMLLLKEYIAAKDGVQRFKYEPSERS